MKQMGNYNNIKATNTELFLVAPMGVARSELREHGFIGAYLGDVHKPEIKYDRGVFMLFKPENMALFNEWVEEEKERTPQLVEDYDYEGGYVVLIYVLPERMASDYEKFLKGRYSKFSREFKEMFTKMVMWKDNMGRSRNEPSIQWRIFKKDGDIRKYWEEEIGTTFTEDMEVWSVPSEDKEMLDINKIKLLYGKEMY